MRELPDWFEYLRSNETISPVLHVAQFVYGVDAIREVASFS